MALSKSVVAKLKKFNINVDELVAAITASEEVDVNIPDGTFFTDEQLVIRDGKKYNEGKEAGEEIAVNEVKKAKGLEFTGRKVEGLVKHLTERPKEETEIITKLQSNIKAIEAEKDLLQSEFGSYKVRSSIKSVIPQLNNGLTAEETLSVLEANGYTFAEKGGKVIAMKNGQPVSDAKSLAELDAKDVINSFLNEKKWVGEQAVDKSGRGGSTNAARGASGAFTNIKEFEANWKESKPGVSMNGAEYEAALKSEVAKAAAAGQQFQFA